MAIHDRSAGRGTDAHGVKLTETRALFGESFHVRCAIEVVEGVTLRITVFVGQKGERAIHQSHVVHQEDDDVGFFNGECGERTDDQAKDKKAKRFHRNRGNFNFFD